MRAWSRRHCCTSARCSRKAMRSNWRSSSASDCRVPVRAVAETRRRWAAAVPSITECSACTPRIGRRIRAPLARPLPALCRATSSAVRSGSAGRPSFTFIIRSSVSASARPLAQMLGRLRRCADFCVSPQDSAAHGVRRATPPPRCRTAAATRAPASAQRARSRR
jgi:hypothetical protein